MKKVIWIFSFCVLSFTMAFSQDENYYPDNSGTNNSSNNYNNDYNNSSYNQPTDQQAYVDNSDDQSYQNFYDQLSPYGNWVEYPGYGVVWVPTQVTADFSPYVTSGHWVYTDYGWTWASDYDWGWAAFHYGRWFRDNTYGWMWMPGNDWAPAWVSWGSYDNYYCWAPMAPYADNYAYYRPAEYSWNFVDREHFCQPNLNIYINNREFHNRGDYRNISAHINIITEAHHEGNRTYFSGPRITEVEHVTGHTISPMVINNINHATAAHISGNQVSMYRPQMRTTVSHAVNTQQFHQPANINQVHSQQFNNHVTVPANHISSNYNYMQGQVKEQQYNRVNPAANQVNNTQAQRAYNPSQNMARQPFNQSSAQNTRPAQQYREPAMQSRPAQSYQAPQHSVEQHSQPMMQRQPERSFASAQRPAATQNNRAINNSAHFGRR